MKTQNSAFQVALEIASIAAIIGMVVLCVTNWFTLPDKVPLHYNFAGEIDRWGSKNELLVVPIIGVIMYVMLTFIARAPKLWNLPYDPTPENAEQLYGATKTMLLWLKLEVMLVFVSLTYAVTMVQNLSALFLPIVFVVIGVTLAYYIYRQKQISRDTRRMITIDSEVVRLKKTFPVSKFWLIVPWGLTVVPFLFILTVQGRGGNGWFYAIMIAFEVVPFCFLYGYAARAKSKFYSEDERVNLALNRHRIREWTRMWVLLAYNAAVNGIICFSILHAAGYSISPAVIVIYFAHAALALFLFIAMKRRLKRMTRLLLSK